MKQPERRRSERLMLSIPVRVIGFDQSTGEFTEDTHTVVINRTGGRIALTHRVAAPSTLRIINLENYREADFRVVSPTCWQGSVITEWGVECLEAGRDIWDIEFPSPAPDQCGALLECQGCRSQGYCVLTPVELEVLEATEAVQRACKQCGKPTYWFFADVTRYPREFPPAEGLIPPAPPKVEKPAEKRRAKRLGMRLPVRVRGPQGQLEVSTSENVSKGGLAVALAMDLQVGDIVYVESPYTPGSQNIEQKCVVRQRAAYAFGGRRLYGLAHSR